MLKSKIILDDCKNNHLINISNHVSTKGFEKNFWMWTTFTFVMILSKLLLNEFK